MEHAALNRNVKTGIIGRPVQIMKVNCFICSRNEDGRLTDIRDIKEMTREEQEEKEIELTYQFAEAMGYEATLIEE